MFTSPLISTQNLMKILDHPNLRLLDGSYGDQQKTRQAFEKQHIPGAQFFDIDAICDPQNPLPHMIPTPEFFAESVGKMGISNDSLIVVYDKDGLFSAARVWWMFRLFGHEDTKIAILDGGLPKWLDQGGAVTDQHLPAPPTTYEPDFHPYLVKTFQDVQQASTENTASIIDARDSMRFMGLIPALSLKMRSGHIPGSYNVPFKDLLNPDFTLKSETELKQIFQETGYDTSKPQIATCGSGVTACILALAAYKLGYKHVAVYDGSWTEWGASEAAVERG